MIYLMGEKRHCSRLEAQRVIVRTHMTAALGEVCSDCGGTRMVRLEEVYRRAGWERLNPWSKTQTVTAIRCNDCDGILA